MCLPFVWGVAMKRRSTLGKETYPPRPRLCGYNCGAGKPPREEIRDASVRASFDDQNAWVFRGAAQNPSLNLNVTVN